MSTTINLHNVGREAYDAIDVLELHGPTAIWKVLYVGDTKVAFFPGAWRFGPQDPDLEEREGMTVIPF